MLAGKKTWAWLNAEVSKIWGIMREKYFVNMFSQIWNFELFILAQHQLLVTLYCHVMSCLSHNWLRQWLGAWWHRTIIGSNVCLNKTYTLAWELLRIERTQNKTKHNRNVCMLDGVYYTQVLMLIIWFSKVIFQGYPYKKVKMVM